MAKSATVSKPKPKLKVEIALGFIGHSALTQKAARALVEEYMARVCKKYTVASVVTIKDDVLGREARRYAKAEGIARETFDRDTNAGNYLPSALTVGATMWAASRFILCPSSNKEQYSSIAQEMCKRMPRKYLLTK